MTTKKVKSQPQTTDQLQQEMTAPEGQGYPSSHVLATTAHSMQRTWHPCGLVDVATRATLPHDTMMPACATQMCVWLALTCPCPLSPWDLSQPCIHESCQLTFMPNRRCSLPHYVRDCLHPASVIVEVHTLEVRVLLQVLKLALVVLDPPLGELIRHLGAELLQPGIL